MIGKVIAGKVASKSPPMFCHWCGKEQDGGLMDAREMSPSPVKRGKIHPLYINLTKIYLCQKHQRRPMLVPKNGMLYIQKG